jgi:predicted phage terminase large subunit-like protein
MTKPTDTVVAAVAARTEEREKCRRDKFYLSEILGYDFQKDVHQPLFDNYISYDDSRPWVEQSTTKKRMVLWSRGFYKTTSIVVEIVQSILNFPDIRILLMQGTVPNTKTLLKEIKSHFDGSNFRSRLKDIFPEFCQTEKKLGTAMDFTVPNRTRTLKDPTVRVASPKTTKSGQHYDAGFFDDLVNDQNYRNPKLIKKAIDDFNMYAPLIDPGGYFFITGTRYAFGDMYEWVQRQDATTHEWNISTRPCWFKDENDNLVSYFPPRKLADGRIVGISVEELKSKQAADPEMFAAQYLNKPISTTAHLFPEELMLSHVRSLVGENAPPLGLKTLFIDLASSTSSSSDQRVLMCGQQDSMGRAYVTDCIGGQWGPLEFSKVIIAKALEHRPIGIYIEGSAAGNIFVSYLKMVAQGLNVMLPLHFIKIDNRKGAKHLRISTLSGILKQDKLFFSAGLPVWDKLLEQFIAYPRARHDDYPDTVALMCNHYETATYRIPPVKSIGQYLTQQHTVIPEIIKDKHQDSYMGGSMGCGFED